MEVLNTALYYTKVCLGFSFKHEKVDIPLKTEIEELRKKAATLDKLIAALKAPEASLFNMREIVIKILHESGYLNLEEE